MRMKKLVIFFAMIALVISCDLNEPDPIFEYTLKSAEVINTNNDFGLELFGEVLANEEEPNLMISPASISIALGMAYNGSETTTRDEFEMLLDYEGLTRKEVNEITRELIQVLVTDKKGSLLEIANSIWCNEGFPVKDTFLQVNQTYFDAEVQTRDFSRPATIEEINNWVKDKTHDKIDEIIKELSPEAMMVLINALYFYSNWETEFDPKETSEMPFYKPDGSLLKQVDMMMTESTFKVAATEDFTAVELPYKDKKFSMHLFLPSENSTVEDLVAELDGATWNEWLERFSERNEFKVYMPKFKFEYERSLNDDLKSLGLEEAFQTDADFSGITDIDLFISKVIHKTYVDVNEEGTEAAAVTAIVFETTSIGPSP